MVDPITSFLRLGSAAQTASMLIREIDLLKSRGVTAVFTALAHAGSLEETHVEVSSLIDTWLLAETVETNGERNRILYIIKSRGMAHSNQLAEFTIGESGIELLEPYVGPAGVLTGSARIVQEAKDRTDEAELARDLGNREHLLEQHKAAIEAQVASLWEGFAVEAAQLDGLGARDEDQGRKSESAIAHERPPLGDPGRARHRFIEEETDAYC